jgi:flagellar biosynthesis/type III secretory pathway chaperone
MNVKIIELMDILDEEAACYRDMQRVLTEEQASISFSRKERFDQVQHAKRKRWWSSSSSLKKREKRWSVNCRKDMQQTAIL